MILALDPTITSTGCVLYDEHNDEIVEIHAIKTEPPDDVKAMKTYHRRRYENEKLANDLLWTMTAADVVVAEVPQGSKSSKADASMKRAEAIVQTTASLLTKTKQQLIEYIPIPQDAVKKALYNQSSVSKSDVVAKMISLYGDFRKIMGQTDKRSIEDCADALAVLHFYRNFKIKQL